MESTRCGLRKMAIGCAAALLLIAIVVAGAEYLTRRYAFTPVVAPIPAADGKYLTPFQHHLLADLDRQIQAGIRYQDGYYVGGDPPPGVGVCTDVVIRAYRAAGMDLKKALAEDVAANAGVYRISLPDPNIDHRRCRNLVVFFRRHALSLPDADWRPGDVVFWDTHRDGRVDHIGMIGGGRDERGDPTIVHHWPGMEVAQTDGLHRFRIMGHFRWKDTV